VASARARHLRPDTPRSGEPTTWGSGQRKSNRSWETWAPFNGRTRPSMQREGSPAMATGLERIAAKARCEPKLRFTSLAHHLTRERVWENLCEIPTNSAPGVDRQTVAEAKESFGDWIEEMLQSVHRQGYRAPDIRRVFPRGSNPPRRPDHGCCCYPNICRARTWGHVSGRRLSSPLEKAAPTSNPRNSLAWVDKGEEQPHPTGRSVKSCYQRHAGNSLRRSVRHS
jgi:hypothetical protein